MSYLGNSPDNQTFLSGTDYFSGNGSTVLFTLSRQVISVNDIIVVVENVVQYPGVAYNVIGNQLTFTGAPQSGTNNIYVRYMSVNTRSIGVSDGAITLPKLQSDVLQPVNISDKANTSTGYFGLPVGTTAQRPINPTNGMTRFNTTLGYPEWYSSTYSTWAPYSSAGPYLIDYTVVAGGGGAGRNRGGGGGAGGMQTVTNVTIAPGTQYSIVIGAGGAGQTSIADSVSGNNSSAFGTTSIGGGRGGGNGWSASPNYSGSSGGSGGGAGSGSGYIGGSGTSGQGNAGGSTGAYTNGASGGGKTAAGANATGSGVVAGGAGATGVDGITYATGGAGGNNVDSTGGGGNGATNKGNGGDGGSGNVDGGTGGSGIVVIKYLGSQHAQGGAITQSGGYTYHTFTSSGTFTA
jgi:hypothetical protein